MSWHALVAAREAVGATWVLLAGRSIPDWTRLALLTVFIGGPTAILVADFNLGSPLGTDPLTFDSIDPELVPVVAISLLVGTVALSVFLLVGAVSEFVILDALRGRPCVILTRFPSHLRPALDLFAFRLALYGLVITNLVLALAAIVGIEGVDGPLATASSLSLMMAALVGLALSRLTSRLVVPVMLVEGCSLREGWGRVRHRIERRPGQYAVYLAVDLAALAGVLVFGAALGALAAIVVVLPIGAFGLGLGSALVAIGLSGEVVTAVVGLLLVPPYLAGTLVLVALVHVPATVYVRYLALLTLAKTDRRYARGADGRLCGTNSTERGG
jgi:hypothetical protein